MRRALVIGAGYVGQGTALALIRRNWETHLVDTNEDTLRFISCGMSALKDFPVKNIHSHIPHNLLGEDTVVFICVPTHGANTYSFINTHSINTEPPGDDGLNTEYVDASIVEDVMGEIIEARPDTTIVIRSTISPNWAREKRIQYGDRIQLFSSPEFLTKANFMDDALNPDRIVVGGKNEQSCRKIARMLTSEDVPFFGFDRMEDAATVKLASNSFLAMRVAFANTVDTFVGKRSDKGSEAILKAIGADPRIGADYLESSFGYGNACLPRDTREFAEVTSSPLIEATVMANNARATALIEKLKKVIADKTVHGKPPLVVIVHPDPDIPFWAQLRDVPAFQRVRFITFGPTSEHGILDEADLIIADRPSSWLNGYEDKLFSGFKAKEEELHLGMDL